MTSPKPSASTSPAAPTSQPKYSLVPDPVSVACAAEDGPVAEPRQRNAAPGTADVLGRAHDHVVVAVSVHVARAVHGLPECELIGAVQVVVTVFARPAAEPA